MYKKIILSLTALLIFGSSCKVKQTTATTQSAPQAEAGPAVNHGFGPHAIVYKTKADYAHYIPVTLSVDGSQITSYPAPTDIYRNGSLATPTVLTQGYLLDNRGVGATTAFVKISYQQYAQYKETPSLNDLMQQIIDKKPFTEMYDLGLRSSFGNEVDEINAIITSGKLKEYKRLL